MDINAADIAALEKILHQAEEWMLENGEEPQAEHVEPPAPEHEGELPPEEASEGEEPALEIEVQAGPKKPEPLEEYHFVGGAAKPRPPAPVERSSKQPVRRR
jgi:hypothetical protein